MSSTVALKSMRITKEQTMATKEYADKLRQEPCPLLSWCRCGSSDVARRLHQFWTTSYHLAFQGLFCRLPPSLSGLGWKFCQLPDLQRARLPDDQTVTKRRETKHPRQKKHFLPYKDNKCIGESRQRCVQALPETHNQLRVSQWSATDQETAQTKKTNRLVP